MKIARKIVFVMISIFLILLVVYNGYWFICINVLKKDMVTVNGYTVLNVVTGSMEPMIQINDLIVIDTKVTEYKRGDVITYYDSEGSFVTHRIVSINENEMIAKGDNNNTEDPPTSPSKIVGKYVTKFANGQKILSAFQNPLVATLILVNGVLFCIFASIDHHGNLILDDEEKEYKEFKEYVKKKSR